MGWDPRVLGSDNRAPRERAEEAFARLRSRFGGPPGGRLVVPAVLALAVLGALATSYVQVEPDEVGVVLRLGRFVGTIDPGPHFRLPFGIERVAKVPVQRQLKAEFGFRTQSVAPSGTRYAANDAELKRESLMLTGDLNVAVVEWIVQYKVKDPYQYLFKVKNVEAMLRDISEASMRAVVGDHSVNEVLTTGRQRVANEAKLLLQGLADRYETGVDIQQVVLQDVNPPDPVKPSFNEVNQAIQEKERAINEAYAELNRELPRARGEAEETLRAAEGYAIERVNRAKGEADRFARVHEEYRRAPDVTRRRMYLDTVAQVLQGARQKVVVDESQKGVTPMLWMEGAKALPAGAAAQLEEAR
jgi:membrane protease subunit HflK